MVLNKDTRIITLNSNDATKLNGSYNSNVFFNIPDIVIENKNIHHLEVCVIDAQIPFSFYLINNETNNLRYTYNGQTYDITITNGNYNANSLIEQLTLGFLNTSGLTASITLSQISGKLDFRWENMATEINFIYLNSVGIFRILGFNNQNYSGYSIIPPNPLNLLGITKLLINSNSLATISSYSSKKSLGNCTICTVPVDVPSWNLISYTNRNNVHGKMKQRYLSNIDIEIRDEFSRYIEFNNIDWNLTLQIIIYRNDDISFNTLEISQNQNEEKTEEKIEEKNKKNKSSKKDLNELKLLTS